MPDMTSILKSFGFQALEVVSVVDGGYDNNGRRVSESETTTTIQAHVQAAAGRGLARLPEGLLTAETRFVWSESPLRCSRDGHRPDLVRIEGLLYEVQNRESWAEYGNFYRHTVVQEDPA